MNANTKEAKAVAESIKAAKEIAESIKAETAYTEIGDKPEPACSMDAKVVDGKVKLHQDCVEPFAAALEAVAVNSYYGNRKHNVAHSWKDGHSEDYLDAALRHLAHARGYDDESCLIHLVPAAWNCLAALSLAVEEGNWNKDGMDANAMIAYFDSIYGQA